MNEALLSQSKRLLQIAEELEKAAAHAKIAANHFKSGEVPRGCAHSFAVEGHIAAASENLTLVAKEHRTKALIE
ncbi:MAG: hypothetical protein AAB966_05065 [Patescibacteria group bacterium]